MPGINLPGMRYRIEPVAEPLTNHPRMTSRILLHGMIIIASSDAIFA